MGLYITYAILIALFSIWAYRTNKKNKKIKEKLEADLEDETILVPEVGRVTWEELGDFAKGDPEEGVKYSKDTMFREDLLKFEGEFPIPGVPLNEERRKSIDDAFLYLIELFGKDLLNNKPALTPADEIFPREINSLFDYTPLAHTIAKIMDIDPKEIEIGFFEGSKPVEPGSLDSGVTNDSAAGLYYGKNEKGKYEVTLADNMINNLDKLIATIAHEFAHIKLLGEGRMDENSEELTDMLPLFYGFGVFNSSSVFSFKRDNQSWSTSSLGYLSQVDWAYLFALYLYVREEKEPEWFKYLSKTIVKDCRIAYIFILENPDKVLQPQ